MAERSDVIVALDTWVLEQACRQPRVWRDHGLGPLRLSVNLASRDLSNPDLFDNVDRTLQETGIDPSLLELEITERVVLDRTGPAKENIERLRRLGVRFTIDDFGTGNSSLSRIGSFPVSTLKIDQSFVQVLGPDEDNNSLVSAIISMADRLGLALRGRGRRDLAPEPGAPPAGLHHRPGLLLQPSAAGRGHRADDGQDRRRARSPMARRRRPRADRPARRVGPVTANYCKQF